LGNKFFDSMQHTLYCKRFLLYRQTSHGRRDS
jgi:hypothetical protein